MVFFSLVYLVVLRIEEMDDFFNYAPILVLLDGICAIGIILYYRYKHPKILILSIEGAELRDKTTNRVRRLVGRQDIRHVIFYFTYYTDSDGEKTYFLTMSLVNNMQVEQKFELREYFDGTPDGRTELTNELINFLVKNWQVDYEIIKK